MLECVIIFLCVHLYDLNIHIHHALFSQSPEKICMGFVRMFTHVHVYTQARAHDIRSACAHTHALKKRVHVTKSTHANISCIFQPNAYHFPATRTHDIQATTIEMPQRALPYLSCSHGGFATRKEHGIHVPETTPGKPCSILTKGCWTQQAWDGMLPMKLGLPQLLSRTPVLA